MNKPGRATHLEGGAESKPEELRYGMDFRCPIHRRAVFILFYEFHLKHKAHPGCIYFLLPFLADKYGWDEEQRLWFAFINGNTQNALTSLVIFNRFPSLASLDPDALKAWFNWAYEDLAFDLDRRHHKKHFVEAVESYIAATGRLQSDYFRHCWGDFVLAWNRVYDGFYSFGRLSSWSYLEYVRLAGADFEPPDLMLRDLSGSKSHRNGLVRVLGRDDLYWHDSNPSFTGQYSEPVMSWLEGEAQILLSECRAQFAGREFERDVNFFTLESALCTYKSMFRPNRRYPGVYLDMMWGRILAAEAKLLPNHAYLSVFREARAACLPKHLRMEENPLDVGLKPAKQNHFRETGQMVMMDGEWPCFKNDYNDSINRTLWS